MIANKYIGDFSLALINRTGAYYVSKDIVEKLPEFFRSLRYWRLYLNREPSFLFRKLLARAMLFELNNPKIIRILDVGSQCYRDCNSAVRALAVFFDPLYVLLAGLDSRDIVLCHDVGPISHPQFFHHRVPHFYQRAYELIQLRKPGMVFVSQASRSEFIHRFGVDYRFMKVIPLYVRQGLTSGDEKALPGISTPFFLTIAGLEARKNHSRIVKAFTATGLLEQGYSHVFCGPRGDKSKEMQALSQTTPGIHYFGYLSDSELRWLYRRASGFVLPSLLEGFGVPVLEAAQHGLISIVSNNTGAQKEAVGDGGILVDPTSVESIAEGMMQVVSMGPEERTRKVDCVRRHAEQLSQHAYLSRWADLLSSSC